MYKKKYTKGMPVPTMMSFEIYVALGKWFYFGSSEQPKHPKVITSMPYFVIKNAVDNRRLWIAKPNKEEKDNGRANRNTKQG